MLELALWLKANGFRADQVQAFLPSPMATATAMYMSGRNPLKKISRDSEDVPVPRGARQRRLHKAFLRYQDPDNWPLLRQALMRMGRADLIGNGKRHLVPRWQPVNRGRRLGEQQSLAAERPTAASRKRSEKKSPSPGSGGAGGGRKRRR